MFFVLTLHIYEISEPTVNEQSVPTFQKGGRGCSRQAKKGSLVFAEVDFFGSN